MNQREYVQMINFLPVNVNCSARMFSFLFRGRIVAYDNAIYCKKRAVSSTQYENINCDGCTRLLLCINLTLEMTFPRSFCITMKDVKFHQLKMRMVCAYSRHLINCFVCLIFLTQEQLLSTSNTLTGTSSELDRTREEVTRLEKLCSEKSEELDRIVREFDNTKRYLEVR